MNNRSEDRYPMTYWLTKPILRASKKTKEDARVLFYLLAVFFVIVCQVGARS